MTWRLACVLAVFSTLASAPARAQGGPPLLTDDPDTPGPNAWEINAAIESEMSDAGHRVEIPTIDVNYGAGDRIQLKFEVPWVAAREAEWDHARRGIGNANAGIKWRFLGAEGTRVAWSIYPQAEFHTSAAALEETPGSVAPIVHVPTEVTVRIAHLELNGELGRSIVSGGGDHWFGGVSTEFEAGDGVEVIAEVHDDKRSDAPSDFIANIGVRAAITRRVRGLFAVGRSLHSGHDVPPHVRVYAGLQFNLPGADDGDAHAR